jgi:Kef-type K+ transport system membrane component KefB
LVCGILVGNLALPGFSWAEGLKTNEVIAALAAIGVILLLFEVTMIAAKAVAFLAASLLAGHFVVPHILRGAGRFESRGVLLAISISFCFLLAWAAGTVGLAPIVGAFDAGLVLD